MKDKFLPFACNNNNKVFLILLEDNIKYINNPAGDANCSHVLDSENTREYYKHIKWVTVITK